MLSGPRRRSEGTLTPALCPREREEGSPWLARGRREPHTRVILSASEESLKGTAVLAAHTWLWRGPLRKFLRSAQDDPFCEPASLRAPSTLARREANEAELPRGVPKEDLGNEKRAFQKREGKLP